MNFVEFLRTPFYIEHLWWLLPELLSKFIEKEFIERINACTESLDKHELKKKKISMFVKTRKYC